MQNGRKLGVLARQRGASTRSNDQLDVACRWREPTHPARRISFHPAGAPSPQFQPLLSMSAGSRLHSPGTRPSALDPGSPSLHWMPLSSHSIFQNLSCPNVNHTLSTMETTTPICRTPYARKSCSRARLRRDRRPSGPLVIHFNLWIDTV